MFDLKKSIVEFAFIEMLLTCLLQERLLLIAIPDTLNQSLSISKSNDNKNYTAFF